LIEFAPRKIPLIAHTSGEHTVSLIRPEFGDPMRLEPALDRGVKLIGTDWSWYSPHSVLPFVDYVDDLYRLKAACPPDNLIRRQTIKLLLNSLYGRWGVGGGGRLQSLVPLRDPYTLADYPDAELKIINGYPYVLAPVSTDHQPAYANVPWAAAITAEARVMMQPWLCQSAESLVYTDTDSLAITGILPVGDRIGDMRQERAGIDLTTYAPKEYIVGADSQVIEAHCKGVPVDLRVAYLRGLQVGFESPVRIIEAAARDRSPGVWIERVRQRRQALPKRCLLSDWTPEALSVPTRAWLASELSELLPPTGFRAEPAPVSLGS